MKKQRLLGSILAMTLALGLAACAGRGGTGTQADKPQESRPAAGEYKVAVLLPGSINDGGWSTTGYEAAKKAAETIGAEFSYTETKSPQDAVDALTDYGERGFTMVFCHSYDYQDACAKVAPDYPNTQFITSGGTIMTENVTPIYVKSEQASYMLGVLAAKMTKTKKVGLVGSEELSAITKTMKGFEQGVKDTDATVEVVITYLGTSTDVGKAREATLALVNNGCDIIFGNANAAAQGVFQAVDECKGQGVLGFGSYGHITQTYPNCFIADMISDYEPVFVEMAEKIKDGTFTPGAQYFADIFNGGANVFFNEKLPVPDEVMEVYNAALEGFRTDSITIDIGEY
ncbi:BMP family protein [Pseudoflavonifractor sp. 524-17]|uniref:BMP family protein n=1 Tax=Pseudoflavonifractor sp. 524-17 TaxID=2304577 RepID=UPI001379691E|nr:BMP family protein [Pseudoflavonifractor sp. 524-17]